MLLHDALHAWKTSALVKGFDMAASECVSSGVPAFNRMNGGGFPRGALSVIGGCGGRTALLMAAGRAALAAKRPVAVIGARDPSHAMTSRLIAACANVEMNVVRAGMLSPDNWSCIQPMFDARAPVWIGGAPLREPVTVLVEHAAAALGVMPVLVLVDDIDAVGADRDTELTKLRAMAQAQGFAAVCTTRRTPAQSRMADAFFELKRRRGDVRESRLELSVTRHWPLFHCWSGEVVVDTRSGVLVDAP